MRRAPHVEPLPCATGLLNPGRQVAAGRACHRDLVSPGDGCPGQVTHADGALGRGLRDDQDAAGLWRWTDPSDRLHSHEQPLTDSSTCCIGRYPPPQAAALPATRALPSICVLRDRRIPLDHAIGERPARSPAGVIAQDEHAGEISAGSSFLSVVDSTFGGHMSETLTLPVLPLDDEVVLPGMVVPIELTDPEIRGAIDAARNKGLGRGPGIRSEDKPQVLLVPRLPDRGLAAVGTLAVVEQVGRLPGGQPGAVVRGTARVKIGSGTTGPGAALWVEGTVIEETNQGPRADELAQQYKTLITSMLQQRGAWQVIDAIQQLTDASAIADRAGYSSYLSAAQKLQLLETADLVERLELVIGWAKEQRVELEVAESIRKDVSEGMEKQQKEFLLRQQLAAVRKELNELTGGGKGTEEDDYRARVEAANLPENVHEAAVREVDKLERTSDQSPEVGWIRTWLDTILDIPWDERTEDAYDIAGARQILDEDHTGLDDVKDRIIEYLAVRKRRSDRGLGVVGGRRSGAVLALVGPPGVGKTSLGESVARAMGRKFVRVSLGGVRDEAEIRGHRRTYVGALPGRIVRAIREAGTMNPVVLLLATANVLDSIPGPLLDRMELVTLDGYTEDEKVAIARDHLLPRQLDKAGLSADEITIGEDALRLIAA